MANNQSLDIQYPDLDSALIKIHGCAVDNLRRLDDLRRAIANLRDGIDPDKDKVWPQLLAKFHLVSKTYLALSQNLMQALRDGGLADFVIFPKNVPADPDAVSELLRTRAEAEIELQDKEYEKEVEAMMGPDKAEVQKRVQAYNVFVDNMQRKIEAARRNFDASAKQLPALDVEPSSAQAGGIPEERLLLAVQRGTGLG
mmetsp:Transcript_12357/g.37688  ORF Transcript_12357/g.37688 Transcript_12357/m.37688 type:complete len:199 (+) Transcript_12357:46-642(+)